MNLYQMARLQVELEQLAEKFDYEFHAEAGLILWPITDTSTGGAIPGQYMLRLKPKEGKNETAA